MSSECEGLPTVGQVCWLEIPVYDHARASKLYSEVFGWKVNPDAMPVGNHGVKSMYMFESEKRKLGGALLLMEEGYQMTRYGKLDKEILPVLPTFCVKECDATLKQVAALGGSTQCPKTAIGRDMGHYARFHDSEGNIIGIWSHN